jgi:hypothetical protein
MRRILRSILTLQIKVKFSFSFWIILHKEQCGLYRPQHLLCQLIQGNVGWVCSCDE